MKQMLFQIDRSLGFKGFSNFCDEITDNLRTEISKPSHQSFARTFTKTRRKVPTVMELELARTCHGGYIPDNAKKFVKNLPRFQKWVDKGIPVVDGRPQPKSKDPSGTQKAPKGNAEMTGEAAGKSNCPSNLFPYRTVGCHPMRYSLTCYPPKSRRPGRYPLGHQTSRFQGGILVGYSCTRCRWPSALASNVTVLAECARMVAARL